MSDHGEDYQARWNARYAGTDWVWSPAPNALLVDTLKHLRPGTALDVGCGEGRHSLWLASKGWQVTGLDFASAGLDKARRRARERQLSIHWLAQDVVDLASHQATYDLVIVMFLHTDPLQRERWMPQVLAAVKPGGTLLYIGHDPSNVVAGVGGPQDERLLPSVAEWLAHMTDFDICAARVVARALGAETGHVGTKNLGRDRRALDAYVHAVRRDAGPSIG